MLLHLDSMGHSDAVVVSDAHFPAWRIGQRTIDLPGVDVSSVLGALRTVLPLDEPTGMAVMEDPSGSSAALHASFMASAGAEERNLSVLSRSEFYDVAARAYLVVRTGETRPFGNAVLFKGLVSPLAVEARGTME